MQRRLNGRILLRRMLRALAALLALPLLYFTAALIGGLVPANAGWRQADRGITIFVRTNGVHTWIMVPTNAAGVDWRPLAPPSHIKDPRYAGDYLAIGYGNREFYLNTPNWSDLSLRTALAAAFGRGPSLVHVEHERSPREDEYQRPLVLSIAEYRKLAAHIGGSFELDRQGRSKPLLGRGYGPADVFYEARGRYDAYRTCNEWTGEALRAAGIRTGLWTPLSESIMLRLGGASEVETP
jgi:uncharacterized protein (TIGR02117 family)